MVLKIVQVVGEGSPIDQAREERIRKAGAKVAAEVEALGGIFDWHRSERDIYQIALTEAEEENARLRAELRREFQTRQEVARTLGEDARFARARAEAWKASSEEWKNAAEISRARAAKANQTPPYIVFGKARDAEEKARRTERLQAVALSPSDGEPRPDVHDPKSRDP